MPWSRPDSGFTLLFEALVMTMVSAMPVAAVARIVGEHDTRLWRVIHHYVEQARARMDAAGVTEVAIDETAARRGHDYITLFVDIDQARVLFATEGKDADTVSSFADDLAAHGGDPEAIEEVCIDMSPAFIKGVSENLPNAAITFDKFHAVKIINDAVDQVRRAEQRRQSLLRGTRYKLVAGFRRRSDLAVSGLGPGISAGVPESGRVQSFGGPNDRNSALASDSDAIGADGVRAICLAAPRPR